MRYCLHPSKLGQPSRKSGQWLNCSSVYPPWVYSQLNVCILYFPGKNPSGATSLSLCRFGSTIGERRNGKTVLSNKITRNRIVLHNSNSPRKPLGRRPCNGLVNIQDGHGSSLKVYDDSAVSESGGLCRAFRMTCKVANATCLHGAGFVKCV